MSLLIGVVIGSVIANICLAILGNPLMWLEDKWRDRKHKTRHFADENAHYICDDHCFWGYSDCPHCKKNEEGLDALNS